MTIQDATGTEQRWDLSDLYTGMNAPELAADLKRLEDEARTFNRDFAGKVGQLDGKALAAAIRRYEEIDEGLSRIMSFAYLLHAGDVADQAIGQFYQSMQEKVTTLSTPLIFFTLEINRMEEADLQQKLKAPELARYSPWLRDVRIFRPHQLSDEVERLLHEKQVAGQSAWMRLYDETLTSLRFPIDGKELTEAEALNLLSNPDRAVRRKAAEAIGKVFTANMRLFTRITNTLAKDKEIEDTWRRYSTPAASRHLANRLEGEVVEALVSSVRAAFPSLSHRYYAMKARWMGGGQLDYWDRNAPLPDADERTIPWTGARDIVLSAYARFSPDMAAVGKRFFDNAWIDVGVRPGKWAGAFAHPTVPSVHPYLLVNYQGKIRDVMTLAHELGHGVHQVLAAKQGHLMADTPLTLAETASVFGEMLTFRSLLDGMKEPKRRKAFLASKVEDMLNTVVRQIAFHGFETRVHTERREGELSTDRLCQIWMDIQTESLGPALRFDEGYRVYWTYIHHFIHSPFYVYAYAFGDCLVNSLYSAYEEEAAAGRGEDFARRYMDMLAAGGTKRHKELLAPFGLDASDPGFWDRGLNVIRRYIDELEALDQA
ncbi:MAG: M3 family oligoendopeptidase [Pseudomonadota bacterium]|nr:M3 family oligoendopeptidase [Pseudomonadota bacterium]